MKKLYRWIIWLLLVHIGIVPIQGRSFIPVDEKLKFGAKLGYVYGLYGLEDFFSCFSPALFITYHFDTIDKGPRYPLFGFLGSRYEAFALEARICYKPIHVHLCRSTIDPQAAWFHSNKEIKSVDFSLKTLSLPISFKYCIGKNRKFSIVFTVAPLYIFSVYKKDWVAALADQPGQGLLRAKIYKNNAPWKGNETLYSEYNTRDPEYKSDRDEFYKKWKNKKEKDQRTYLSASTVFNGSIGLEVFILPGIEYETNNGCILNWNILNASFLGKSQTLLSSVFSIGYNFNKLLHNDTYRKNKLEVKIK